MRIAVIDDGINSRYYPVIGNLYFDLRVNEQNIIMHRRGYDPFTPSHGTTCAGIIKKYSPKAEIGSIKIISDNTHKAKLNQLITALEWCKENNIRIIHMSIGSREMKDVPIISQIVQKLIDKGSVIVAALTNTMNFSAPACLSNVFGVRTSSILKDDQFLCDDCGLASTPFVASSIHELTDYTQTTHTTPFCNSFAAPLITAKVYKLLEKDTMLTPPRIYKLLGGTDKIYSYPELLKRTPLLSDAVDIPIICVDGKPTSAARAVMEMNRLFLKEGYACVPFGNNSLAIDFGLTVIPKDAPVKNLFSFYANSFELDIILFATSNLSYGDAHIHLSASAKRNHYTYDDVTIPENFTDAQIKKVMKYIIKHGQ